MHGSEGLHLPKSHCQLNIECIGINGAQKTSNQTQGKFPLLISEHYLELLITKSQILVICEKKFTIGNCKEDTQVKRESIKM